jgi:cytoskeletal protein CcmA (bactofilin family)
MTEEVGMKARTAMIAVLVAILATLLPAASALADGPDESGAELTGVIESLPATADLTGDWVVSGRTVHVSSSTEIDQEHGSAAVGATVEVKGTPGADGSITATTIEVRESAEEDDFGQIEFQGIVESLPATTGFVGDWSVSGRTVHITTSTEIEQEGGTLAVGVAVEVRGLAEADGSVTATKVKVRDEAQIDDGSVSLVGTLQRIPDSPSRVGAWRVSRHTVRVRETTRIVHAAKLRRGVTLMVSGHWNSDGSIRASNIVVRTR